MNRHILLDMRVLRFCRGAVLALLIVASVFVISVAFIDLYDPGSLIPVEITNIFNFILVLTIIFSIPLFGDKMDRYEKWQHRLEKLDDDEKNNMYWQAARPIIKDMLIVVIMAIAAIIIFNFVWPHIVPAQVIQNYQTYYSSPGICDNPGFFINQSFNQSNVSGISGRSI